MKLGKKSKFQFGVYNIWLLCPKKYFIKQCQLKKIHIDLNVKKILFQFQKSLGRGIHSLAMAMFSADSQQWPPNIIPGSEHIQLRCKVLFTSQLESSPCHQTIILLVPYAADTSKYNPRYCEGTIAVAITDIVKIAGNRAGWYHSLPLPPWTTFVLFDERHSHHHKHTPAVAMVPSLQNFPAHLICTGLICGSSLFRWQ